MTTDVRVGAELKLTGLSSFKSGMADASKKTKSLRDRLREVNKDGKGSMMAIGRGMKRLTGVAGSLAKSLTGVTAAIAAIGLASVDAFGKFDLQMAKLQTVLPAGTNALQEFGDKALSTAGQFGVKVAQVSEAMFQAVSAGVPDKELNRFTQVVGEAARGGFTQMNTVVDGLTTVINAYGMEMSEARTVSDAFFTANRLGKTTFEELSASIGRVAPTANALGISYNELLAATISMTKGGVKTKEVMSSLKAVFANIAKPTDDAKDVAKQLGIEFNVAALKSQGMGKFLNKLTAATQGSAEAQVRLFGSVEAFNSIARLTSQAGLKEFNDGLSALERSSDDTKRAFTGVQDTVGFKMQQIKNSFGRFALEIGRGLVEGLGLDKIDNIPDAIARTAKTVRNSAKAFAQGFKQAFAPLQSTAKFNWAGLAKTLGMAAANIVNAFMKVAEIIGSVLNSQGFKDFMFVTGAVLSGKKGIAEGGAGAAFKATGATDELVGVRVTGGGPGGAVKFSRANESVIRSEAAQRAERKAGGTIPFMLKSAAERRAAITAQERGIRSQNRRTMENLRRTPSASESPRISDLSTGGFDAAAAQHFQKQQGALGTTKVGATMADLETKFEVNINQTNNLNLKDKKSSRGGGFSARGRGNANLQSTSEQMYIITENQVIPMGEEFHFSQLLNEVNN